MNTMSTDVEIQPVLRDLFRSQRFAVLATDDEGQPFASLMAFAATEDLRQIVVLTERARRKFANLKANSSVALLIDDRENKGSDTQDSVAVTALGEAQDVDPDSPAAKAGIEPGWQILKFDAANIQTVRDYLAAFRKIKPGQAVELTVRKPDGTETSLKLEIGTVPP